MKSFFCYTQKAHTKIYKLIVCLNVCLITNDKNRFPWLPKTGKQIFFPPSFPFDSSFCGGRNIYSTLPPQREKLKHVFALHNGLFFLLHKNDPEPLDTPKKEIKLFYGTVSHKRKIISTKKIEDFSAITEASFIIFKEKKVGIRRIREHTSSYEKNIE